MINEIYAIFDDASECFVQFIPYVNEKIAKMAIEKMFKEKRLQIPLIYDYPNHFSVYKLATFDDNIGLFTQCEQHKLLLNFSSIADNQTVAPSCNSLSS